MTHGDRIKRDILATGLRLWRAGIEPSARRIGSELDMSHSNVLYHFTTSLGLRNAVAYYAVKEGESRVVVRLIAEGHRAIAAMDDGERQQHLTAVRGLVNGVQ